MGVIVAAVGLSSTPFELTGVSVKHTMKSRRVPEATTLLHNHTNNPLVAFINGGVVTCCSHVHDVYLVWQDDDE